MSATTKRRSRTSAVGVYRSSSGSFEVSYRDSDGRLRFKVIPGDLEAAKAARADIVSRKAKGERVAPSRVTLDAYAEDVYFPSLLLRPRTIEIYMASYRLYVKPTLGSKQLTAITVDDIAKLIAALTRRGFAAWTIRGALTVVSRIFATAERASLVPSNPVRKLTLGERPAGHRREQRILTTDEVSRLLDAAGSFRPLIAVGAFCGLRLGEALGLTWEQVDFERGFVRVRNQLNHNRELVELKTGRSRRDVVLIPALAKVLRQHKLASRFSGDADFVFPAPDGRGRERRSTSRGIERAVERAGVGPLSFHGLRHGFASMLISGLGTDVETVSRQLGHANSAITLSLYSHEFDAARTSDELRDKLAAGFGHLLAGQAPSS